MCMGAHARVYQVMLIVLFERIVASGGLVVHSQALFLRVCFQFYCIKTHSHTPAPPPSTSTARAGAIRTYSPRLSGKSTRSSACSTCTRASARGHLAASGSIWLNSRCVARMRQYGQFAMPS